MVAGKSDRDVPVSNWGSGWSSRGRPGDRYSVGFPCATPIPTSVGADLSVAMACCPKMLRQASMRRSGLLGVVIGALALCAAACGHPGGDPGGGILSVLTRVQGAVPPGSTDVSSTTEPASWLGSCNDEYFKKGWGEIGVTLQFTSSDSDATIHRDVSRWMSAHGWKDAKSDTEEPGDPRWTRSLPEGVTATAFLSYGADRFPPVINATAPPEPPVGECAGG
jgi:hypothetical protein